MTKAEEFKRAAEVAAQAKKSPKAPREPASHKKGAARTKAASYELEVSATKRPSRKSTRKALNRQKNDSALRIKQTNRAAAPSSRTAQR